MPRYDDRGSRDGRGTTRLYVGHLSSRTLARDLEDVFSRYGRVRDVDMKRDHAFVEFSDPRDADDARYSLNGRDVGGSRIIVEFAKGVPRGSGGSRDYQGGGGGGGGGRGPPPGTGRCFNCGLDGHWARDCDAGDWKNKCYRCGERGHIERRCTNSPRKSLHGHGRSYSRSPSPRRERSLRHGHGRSYSRSPSPRRERSLSRSRSYSRSRSPVRRDRSRDRVGRRSRSPKRHRASPQLSKGRKHRSDSDDRSTREKGTPSPRDDKQANGSDYSGSPKNNIDKDTVVKDSSPLEENGHSHSPSPITRDDESPVDDPENGSPRGSESDQ